MTNKEKMEVITGEEYRGKENDRDHSFTWELIGNARRDSMRWFIVVILLVAVTATQQWYFTRKTQAMNNEFAETVKTINQQHLDYLSQYDFESYEISSDGGGNANYIGNDGDIYNGESESAEANQEEGERQRQGG